jgi:glycosyltransferase involved in cell wall biosynthesis
LTGQADLIAQADSARDAKNWRHAGDLYKQALELNPAAADIWVQYGHALKESGQLTEAKVAYERALELDEGVADFHLQLGHALKLLGDIGGAVRSYARAHDLDPTLSAAVRELVHLDPDFSLPDVEARAQCIAVDLSDVFFYLRHHDTLSGIQRVQMGIANAIIDLGDKIDGNISFVVDGGAIGTYLALRPEAIGRLTKELSSRSVSHAKLLDILAEEEGWGSVFPLKSGDTLVVLGAFWVIENAVERFVRVKQLGARLVVLIHDIIPITHPEYCERSLTDAFVMFCVHVLQIADVVLTVSDHAGRQVRAFLTSKKLKPPPIHTLRSAHKTLRQPPAPRALAKAQAARGRDRPYVLYVSTIEIRKNHILLFRIWKALISKHGADAVPKLIFVGRPGWRVRDFMDQLDSTRYLDDHIEIIHGIPDAELADLYASALFTAFPSFEEGWGLPVGESLLFGRPCVASTTSSIPEVAGDFVAYEDPNNLSASLALYERMIFDDAYRETFVKKIKESFQPRTWAEVATDLLGLIKICAPNDAKLGAVTPAAMLAPGKLYQLGHGGDTAEYLRSGLGECVHFMFDDGWGVIEEHIRWQLKRTAYLRFNVSYEAPGEVLLVLWIETVPWLGDTSLRISVNNPSVQAMESAQVGMRKVYLRQHLTGPEVAIRFEIDGPIVAGPDPRPLSYGVRAIGYAGLSDYASRLDLSEAILFQSVGFEEVRPGERPKQRDMRNDQTSLPSNTTPASPDSPLVFD